MSNLFSLNTGYIKLVCLSQQVLVYSISLLSGSYNKYTFYSVSHKLELSRLHHISRTYVDSCVCNFL